MKAACLNCGTDSDGDTCPICHKYDDSDYVIDDSKPPRVVALERELAETRRRFTAEDVRQVMIDLLKIMREFRSSENVVLIQTESAFALLYETLLQEEKKRNGK